MSSVSQGCGFGCGFFLAAAVFLLFAIVVLAIL